jgi:predicted esterase
MTLCRTKKFFPDLKAKDEGCGNVILSEVIEVTDLTYNQLMNRAGELYRNGEFLAAYDLVTRNSSKVGGNAAQLLNFRYCFACRAGRPGLAMNIMKEAVIDRGFWYSYEYLISDDDLQPLRDLPEFRRMADICKERERAAKEASRPGLTVVLPESDSKAERAVLIALHGNEESDMLARSNWVKAGGSDRTMAFPRSSEIGFSDGYYWNEVAKGVAELKVHIRNIEDRFSLEGGDIVLGGFSAGARVVLHTMLEDEAEARGFILVAPWLPDLDVLGPKIGLLRRRGVRGHIICGERDKECVDHATRLVALMRQEGVPHRFMSVPGLDHDFPEGFADQVPAIIDHLKRLPENI